MITPYELDSLIYMPGRSKKYKWVKKVENKRNSVKFKYKFKKCSRNSSNRPKMIFEVHVNL